MKSKKIIAIAKGLWAFCSYLFVPQCRPKDIEQLYGDKEDNAEDTDAGRI